MKRITRAAATAMAAAFVLSTVLTTPILAAKPTGGGGGGGTTTTTFTGSATAATPYTIVVGAITKVTFTYRWTNGLNRTFRMQVPTSYSKPQTLTPFDIETGDGAAYVVKSGTQPSGACASTDVTASGQFISVTTGDCTSGSFAFDFYAQASATGGAKFPVYVDLGSAISTTAFTTLTLNASSAKVAITGISYTDGSTPTTINAGDIVRVTAKVTDAKAKTSVPLVGVPLTFTDNALSTVLGGALACPGISETEIVCSNSTGTAWMDFRVEGANQHQVRAAIGSYSGQKSFTVAAGALAGVSVAQATSGNLALGQTRVLIATGRDAYSNARAVTAADLDWSTDATDGDVTLTGEATNLDGTVSITATGATTGDVVVTVESVDSASIADSTTLTVVEGDIASLTLSGETTALTAGDPRILTVHAENAFGEQVTLMADDIDWTTGAGQEASVSFSGESASSGDVSIVVTGEKAGTVEVIAGAPDVSLTDGIMFSVVAGPATQLFITSDGSDEITSGSHLRFTVTAADAKDNPVSLAGETASFTTGDGEDTYFQVFGGNALGIELIGKLVGTVHLTATVGDLSAATSFRVVPGDVKYVFLTTEDDGTLDGTDSTTYTVSAMDDAGNDIDLTGLTYSLVGTTDLGEVSIVEDIARKGEYLVTGVTNGTVVLTATVSGVTGTSTPTVTITGII